MSKGNEHDIDIAISYIYNVRGMYGMYRWA